MYRLPLIGTRTAAISVANVPVETAPSAVFVFVFLIAAVMVSMAAVTIPTVIMAIPVGAVHVVTAPLAVVAVLAPTTLTLPPSPLFPPTLRPTSLMPNAKKRRK